MNAWWRWAAALVLCLAGAASGWGQAAPGSGLRPAASPWTLEEAMAHLRLYPRDAYVQYVALQLARAEGKVAETAAEIARRNPVVNASRTRREGINLYSIFTGQLAVQESLQLDAMAPDDVPAGPGQAEGRAGPRPLGGQSHSTVPVADLVGPTVQSHPWHEMLVGREPEVTGLALVVPVDFYFVRFNSLSKLLEAADLATLYGAHAMNQSQHEARTQLVGQRLREQLAVEDSPLLRPFYDQAVDEAAIVGSDLFLRAGSDVTMLFHLRRPDLFRAKMDQLLAAAEQQHEDAVRSEGRVLGVDYVHVSTPDRRVHVFSAYPRPDLHVRANCRAALERVLACIAGRDADGRAVERLGETDEFRYVRTLFPEGAAEEDGLVYLSDPFVRRLMGPEVRLSERRRQVCYNHLRMIGHAGLLHRTQTGRTAPSLAALVEAGCAPGEFGQGKLACLEDGTYTLAADGVTGVCSHHGYGSYLTPNLEAPTTHVSSAEAKTYEGFVAEYNQYWRQFFDPIAIRVQASPEQYRLETIVLPLIDNSIYRQLAQMLGGEAEPLDELPVPGRNIFSVAVRLNKAQLLANWGLEQFISSDEPNSSEAVQRAETERAAASFARVFWAMMSHWSSERRLPEADNGGLSWRVGLLPRLGRQDLYDQFHHDEPWDSPHNRTLIPRMPDEFRSADAQLNNAGKTRYVVPRGAGTLFSAKDVLTKANADQRTNMLMLLEAADEHAVVWTSPEDIELDPRMAAQDLMIRPPGGFLAGFVGHMQMLRQDIAPEAVAAALTGTSDNRALWQQFALPMPNTRPGGPWRQERQAELFARLRLGEVISKGLGNQIAFHVYDSDPVFDFSLAQMAGLTLGNMRGRIDDDFLMLFPLIGALNGPVYLSIPVQDRALVDGFLDRLDALLAEQAARSESLGFFRINQDFYRLPDESSHDVRAYGFGFGPLKWRFFFSRIGDALYVASKREVIADLAALADESAPRMAGGRGRGDRCDLAHGLVRLRPQHWDRVLTSYRLGWAENNRQACLQNLGPLAGLSRALAAGHEDHASVSLGDVEQYAARVYDVHHFCPDAGQYLVAGDGREVRCSLHGTMSEPRQSTAPAAGSELGDLVRQFSDMTIALTFLEDGLHATVILERANPTGQTQP